MSAVDRFYENQTPANAVRLAKADHDALNMGNGIREFEHQLNVAAARLDVYDELVAALEAIIKESGVKQFDDDDEPTGTITKMAHIAHAALAKVRP